MDKNYAWALFKEIVSLSSDLLLLETSASSQNISGNVVDGGLEDSSGGLGNSGDIFTGDSAGTEDASVSEPLSGKISDGELGQDNLGSNIMNFL